MRLTTPGLWRMRWLAWRGGRHNKAVSPVEVGLVTSLAKPGGNVTGMTVFASEIPGKRLQLFRELIPNLT
jgi:hypothetical protein